MPEGSSHDREAVWESRSRTADANANALGHISRYTLAIVLVVLAFYIRYVLNPLLAAQSPFILFVPPALLATLLGGLGPGILSAVLGCVLSTYFFLPPFQTFVPLGTSQVVQSIIYLCAVAIGIGTIEALHRSRRRLEISSQQIRQEIEQRLKFEQELRKSEHIFSLFVANVTDYAIFILDPGGRVMTWNAGAEKISGHKRHEIVGQHFSCFYSREDIESAKPMWELERAKIEGRFEDEGWRIRKDGSRYWANMVLTAIRDEQGTLLGFAKITRDFTLRRASEEALRASEERVRAIVTTAIDGIITIDERGLIESANPAAEKIFGYPAEEIIGRNVNMLMPEPDRSRHDQYLANYHQTGQRKIIEIGREVQGRRRDGSLFPMDLAVAESWIEGRRIYTGLVRDITSRKQAEDTLKQQAELLDLAQILVRDLSDKVIVWNTGAENFYGWSRKEALGQVAHELLCTRFPMPLHEIRTQLFKQGHWEGELTQRMKNQDLRIVSSHWLLHKNADGHPTAILEVISDITERKKLEEALRQSEEIFRLTVENATDFAIMTLDGDGRVIQWNTGAERLFGWKEGEVLGRYIDFIFLPEDRDAGILQKELTIAREKGGAEEERWHLTKAGEKIFISGSTRPLYGTNGNIRGFAKLGTNLTQRKKMEDELRQSRDFLEKRIAERTAKLEESLKAMQTFTYSIAHDLRAPLRAMRGFSHVLREEYEHKLDEQAKIYSRRIDEAAARMDQLVNDLLEFGQLAHARVNLEVVKMDLLLNRVLELLQSEISEKRASVRIKGPLPAACGDKVILERVFTNLISNSLKFVAPDVLPEITIHGEKSGAKVRIWVADNGIGIEPQFHQQIFGTFQRLHDMKSYPGTGMGLAIVRKGVELMDGQVGVESELGKGSHFWVELPDAMQCQDHHYHG